VHFSAAAGFGVWRHIIECRHRARHFVCWSFHHAHVRALMQQFLDILRENAGACAHRMNYLPFRVDGEKGFLVAEKRSPAQAKILRRAARARASSRDPFRFFGSTVADTLRCARCPAAFRWRRPTGGGLRIGVR
jgi:hypothetical protein